MRPVPSRACRLDSQHGLEGLRRSAAEGGEAAQGRRHGRRPQARRDRQRLVQITRIMGGESRMTDLRCRGRMGPWECGQSKPGPRHGRKRRKGLSTFPRPNPKRILYEKAPQGCCGMESAESGSAADSGECGKRGQSGPRTRNPNAARIRIVHRFPCSPRRREPKSASSQMQRRQAEGWQGCGQSRP